MLLFYLTLLILWNMYFIFISQTTEHKHMKQAAQGHSKVRIRVLNVQSSFQTSALPNHQPPCPASSAVWAWFPWSISTECPAKPPTLLMSQPALLNYTFKSHRKEKRKRKQASSGLHLPLHCSSWMSAHFQLQDQRYVLTSKLNILRTWRKGLP